MLKYSWVWHKGSYKSLTGRKLQVGSSIGSFYRLLQAVNLTFLLSLLISSILLPASPPSPVLFRLWAPGPGHNFPLCRHSICAVSSGQKDAGATLKQTLKSCTHEKGDRNFNSSAPFSLWAFLLSHFHGFDFLKTLPSLHFSLPLFSHFSNLLERGKLFERCSYFYSEAGHSMRDGPVCPWKKSL